MESKDHFQLSDLTPKGYPQPVRISDHRLLRRIGGGSYGDVWLAETATGTLRAVKIVHRARFESERPYEREFTGLKHFEPISREHEGLVDILQVGRDDKEGLFYYIMELADAAAEAGVESNTTSGANATPIVSQPAKPTAPSNRNDAYRPATLESFIRGKGRVPVAECIRITTILAEALVHLHSRGLVHRDIKPSNIIFVSGVPKLADVGLVAQRESARTFVGTEGFVPPEGPGTEQADIYSLGKCLYEMAMGKDRQAFPSPPTLLDEIPDRVALLELNEIINKACAPECKARYRSAREFADDLHHLATGGSLKARDRRKRSQLAVAIAALAMAVLALGFFWFSRHQLQLVREFAPPAGFEANGGRVGTYHGDAEPDLFYAQDRRLAVTTLTGAELKRETWSGEQTDRFNLQLLADLDADGSDHPIINTRNGTNLALRIFNDRLIESASIHELGGVATRVDTNSPPIPWSDFRCWRFFPATERPTHLPPRLLTETQHGYATNLHRHVQMVSLEQNHRVLWEHPMAGSAAEIVFADLDGDGLEDMVIGTSASNNHMTLEDGRRDNRSELIVLRHDGTQIFSTALGGLLSQVSPLIDTNGPKPCLLVSCGREVETSLDARSSKDPEEQNLPAEGHLMKFDLAGKQLAEWDTTNEITTFLVLPGGKGRGPLVLTTDAEGLLLAHDFDTLQSAGPPVAVVRKKRDAVHADLIGIEDLDGDGRPEILLETTQITFAKNRGMGHPDDPSSRPTCYDSQIHVLDANLKPVTVFQRKVWKGQVSHPPLGRIIHGGPQKAPMLLVQDEAVHLLRFR